jgi:hypothetical protein
MLLFLSCKCLVFGNGLTNKDEVGINVTEWPYVYFASSPYATDQQSLHLEIYFNIFSTEYYETEMLGVCTIFAKEKLSSAQHIC